MLGIALKPVLRRCVAGVANGDGEDAGIPGNGFQSGCTCSHDLNLVQLFNFDGDALGVSHRGLVFVACGDLENIGAGADIAGIRWVRRQIGINVFQAQVKRFVGVCCPLGGEDEGGGLIERSRPHVGAWEEEIISARNGNLHHGGGNFHRLVAGSLVQN